MKFRQHPILLFIPFSLQLCPSNSPCPQMSTISCWPNSMPPCTLAFIALPWQHGKSDHLTGRLHLLGDGDAVSTIKAHPDLSDPPSTTVSMGPSVLHLWVQLLLFSDLPDQSHLSTSIHPFLISNTSMTDPLYRQTHPYNTWRRGGRGVVSLSR